MKRKARLPSYTHPPIIKEIPMKIEITYGKRTIRKIKIHNRDLWALHDNLAEIILKCLQKYRKTQGKDGVGYPANFCSQIHVIHWDKEQETKDVQQWLDTLDKMIYAFESIVIDRFMDDINDKEFDKEQDMIFKKYKKKDRIDAYNSDEMSELYKKYNSHIEEQKRRVAEGLQLFAQYFETLWV